MSLARSIPFFLIAWCATPALAQDPASPTWEFLATKYDADHDGRVSRAEYPRGDAPFARLDQDGDGAITPADFAARGGPDPAERRAMIEAMTPSMLVRCFASVGAVELARTELAAKLGAIDADGDGSIARAELDTEFAARGAAPFQAMGLDRFGVLLGATSLVRDEAPSPDSAIDIAHLLALFDRFDLDHDGRLAGAEVPDPGRAGRRVRPNEDEANARAAAGNIAPDFTLASEDGQREVTLSAFAGDRPVALIFGSFT